MGTIHGPRPYQDRALPLSYEGIDTLDQTEPQGVAIETIPENLQQAITIICMLCTKFTATLMIHTEWYVLYRRNKHVDQTSSN